MPTFSRSPPTTKSPFVVRESSAFATLNEVCGGMNELEWSHDDEEDTIHALKMEISPFDGRNVQKYAEAFGRYLVLTGKVKAKVRVKANLIVQGIKHPDLQERVSKLLKKATSFEDFLSKLQDLYPTLETDLSILGEISKVSHLPYDPKPEQAVKLFETLERLFNKLNRGDMNDERKLLELSSKIKDKLFVEWTKDNNLFARMHSYSSLRDLMKERAQLSWGVSAPLWSPGDEFLPPFFFFFSISFSFFTVFLIFSTCDLPPPPPSPLIPFDRSTRWDHVHVNESSLLSMMLSSCSFSYIIQDFGDRNPI